MVCLVYLYIKGQTAFKGMIQTNFTKIHIFFKSDLLGTHISLVMINKLFVSNCVEEHCSD